jgi:hypothetical protein
MFYRACHLFARAKFSGGPRDLYRPAKRKFWKCWWLGRSQQGNRGGTGIEERTVKAHVAKLMRKVGVQNRIALIGACDHTLVGHGEVNRIPRLLLASARGNLVGEWDLPHTPLTYHRTWETGLGVEIRVATFSPAFFARTRLLRSYPIDNHSSQKSLNILWNQPVKLKIETNPSQKAEN